jgi:hypothetical protein
MGAGEGETLSHGDAGYFEQHNDMRNLVKSSKCKKCIILQNQG